jgi:hypothetical protein
MVAAVGVSVILVMEAFKAVQRLVRPLSANNGRADNNRRFPRK